MGWGYEGSYSPYIHANTLNHVFLTSRCGARFRTELGTSRVLTAAQPGILIAMSDGGRRGMRLLLPSQSGELEGCPSIESLVSSRQDHSHETPGAPRNGRTRDPSIVRVSACFTKASAPPRTTEAPRRGGPKKTATVHYKVKLVSNIGRR